MCVCVYVKLSRVHLVSSFVVCFVTFVPPAEQEQILDSSSVNRCGVNFTEAASGGFTLTCVCDEIKLLFSIKKHK